MKDLKIYFIIAIILVVGIVLVRLETIRLGYVYQSVKKIKKTKLESFYKLKLIYAETSSPVKITIKAKKMGLIKPTESQFRYIKMMEN